MKNKIIKIGRSFILLFIFFNSVVIQYMPFTLFHANIDDYMGNTKLGVLLSTLSDLVLFAIIICMYRKDIREEFSTFIKKIRYNMDTGLACWGVGLIIMFVSNFILVSFFHAEGANNEIAVRSMIHSMPIMMGLTVCLFAPFIEEFVFRKTLKDIFSNSKIFIVLSFLLFGGAHVYGMATSLVDWLYLIPYGALGGAFALAYYKTDTVFTSMAFHMLHNTFVFLIVILL